jgi:phenylacetate-CoA ligase
MGGTAKGEADEGKAATHGAAMGTLPAEVEQRFPGLTAAGVGRLRWLSEHLHAPRFNHLGVDRLTAEGAARVAGFEAALHSQPRGWAQGEVPGWLADWAAFCWREVPAYRGYGPAPADFFDIPPTDRAELSRAPWAFVPDSQPLDGLTVYQTSGATGHPLDILTHPEALAHYLPLLRAALGELGVDWPAPEYEARGATGVSGAGGGLYSVRGRGPSRAGAAWKRSAQRARSGRQKRGRPIRSEVPGAALAVVCFQASTYTYAAVSRYLGEAGMIKINLHPAEWRDPADRAAYLDACRPAVYSGDPVSLAELARLPLETRPRALVSTAMALLPGLQRQLEERFGCPVIDVYSMNESGPIGVAAPAGAPDHGAYRLLSHRLYVEVLDVEGQPCAPGERGEIALSGGFNPFLPLLRYRTGDWASLDLSDRQQARLVGLEGRAPVVFQASDGRAVNNIDVTAALKPLALPQYALHQAANGSLRMRAAAAAENEAAIRAALAGVFGSNLVLTIEALDSAAAGKVVQYSRDPEATRS